MNLYQVFSLGVQFAFRYFTYWVLHSALIGKYPISSAHLLPRGPSLIFRRCWRRFGVFQKLAFQSAVVAVRHLSADDDLSLLHHYRLLINKICCTHSWICVQRDKKRVMTSRFNCLTSSLWSVSPDDQAAWKACGRKSGWVVSRCVNIGREMW